MYFRFLQLISRLLFTIRVSGSKLIIYEQQFIKMMISVKSIYGIKKWIMPVGIR
jgi:hypothetical protein